MEVFVRNLQQEATEKQVRQYFRPILAELGINVFHCQKPRNKGFAKITLLDHRSGQRFLDIHGQLVPGFQGFKTVKKKLHHMNRPLNCSLSNTAPDDYILKSLEREKAVKIMSKRSYAPTASVVSEKQSRRIFNFNMIYCGGMDYVGSDLAFIPYYGKARSGRLVFGRHFVLVDFSTSVVASLAQQMEIPYSSIQSLIMGRSADPLITFSLLFAPRIFERIAQPEDYLVNGITQLGLAKSQKKQNVPERRRISALDSSHQTVVASCLCYRFHIYPTDIPSILALKRLPGYPDIVSWNMKMLQQAPFHMQMSDLNRGLNSIKFQKYPFELKFYLQKLAQNGYLAPHKVLQVMRGIRKTFLNADLSALADAVYKLFGQIPFPGVETEGSEISLFTLQDLLANNYSKVIREKAYSKGLSTEYEQIAMIYKATVTPVGIYLYGPEPEIKNRVLRKYSDYINFFLQVTFADEDGEPLRYERTTSLSSVYQERFKAVLEGNITIAGRPYEVSTSTMLIIGLCL